MKKFNYVYFKGKEMHREGVYFIYQTEDKEIHFDSMYPIKHCDENLDMISYGVLNRINYLIELGYKFDPYLNVNIEEIL